MKSQKSEFLEQIDGLIQEINYSGENILGGDSNGHIEKSSGGYERCIQDMGMERKRVQQ